MDRTQTRTNSIDMDGSVHHAGHEEDWITRILDQTLEVTRTGNTTQVGYKVLYTHLASMLREAQVNVILR